MGISAAAPMRNATPGMPARDAQERLASRSTARRAVDSLLLFANSRGCENRSASTLRHKSLFGKRYRRGIGDFRVDRVNRPRGGCRTAACPGTFFAEPIPHPETRMTSRFAAIRSGSGGGLPVAKC